MNKKISRICSRKDARYNVTNVNVRFDESTWLNEIKYFKILEIVSF
jgi:hypothetical protein